jgi:hypothetical protein
MDNFESSEKWTEFARAYKESVVNKPKNGGEICPLVVVERNNEILTFVKAPACDRDMGLAAARLLKLGFDPDALVLIFDVHMKAFDKEQDQAEQSEQEFVQQLKEAYPEGLQKGREGGDKSIKEALLCYRVNRDLSCHMVLLPYERDDKNLTWGETQTDVNPGSGYLPESLKSIMDLVPLADRIDEVFDKTSNDPEFEKMVDAVLEKYRQYEDDFKAFSRERKLFHTSRMTMTMLHQADFEVLDLLSKRHIDWTDASERGLAIVSGMVKDGIVPKDALKLFGPVIEKYMGTDQFIEKFTNIITLYNYFFPAEWRENLKSFPEAFEASCIEFTRFPKSPPESDSKQQNQRVRVWNGDKSEFLGEGNYVGDVSVYFFRMPDGSLQSLKNAEIEPSEDLVPEGAVVVESDGNPKIVLDSGQTVYGCQVWWEPVPEGPPACPGFSMN